MPDYISFYPDLEYQHTRSSKTRSSRCALPGYPCISTSRTNNERSRYISSAILECAKLRFPTNTVGTILGKLSHYFQHSSFDVDTPRGDDFGQHGNLPSLQPYASSLHTANLATICRPNSQSPLQSQTNRYHLAFRSAKFRRISRTRIDNGM